LKFKDQIVVVTGASRGIGLAIAKSFAEQGATLAICSTNDEKASATAAEIANEYGVSAYGKGVDISSFDSTAEFIKSVVDTYGKIDVLINNAGISDARPFMDYRYEKIKKIFDINVTGTIYLTKTFLPLVLKNKGTVVNVGSMFGDIAHPLYSIYSSSKFAIKGFSDALRREYMHEGLNVSYVAPRATQTDALDSTKEYGQFFDMNIDQPKVVAKHIIENVKQEKDYIYPKSIERLFVFIQKLFPKIIDKNLNEKIKHI
jgi:short-subunit dehydrogenase